MVVMETDGLGRGIVIGSWFQRVQRGLSWNSGHRLFLMPMNSSLGLPFNGAKFDPFGLGTAYHLEFRSTCQKEVQGSFN